MSLLDHRFESIIEQQPIWQSGQCILQTTYPALFTSPAQLKLKRQSVGNDTQPFHDRRGMRHGSASRNHQGSEHNLAFVTQR